MFENGSILEGIFLLRDTTKKKYAIVLYNENNQCIITTFTTSQKRSSVSNPDHGPNPKDKPRSYVFKANKAIGVCPNGLPFSFPLDTTVVPDYGVAQSSISGFQKKVSGLTKLCDLYPKEYEDLIYTLYKCQDLDKELIPVFEKLLSEICK